MGVMAVIFLVIPLTIYTAATIHRHLSGKEKMSLDDELMDVGNAFGMSATVALSVVLIPVSRHSPLLRMLSSWSPAHAIYLHHMAGRLVVIGGLIHGCMHTYRWTILQGHGFFEMIVPPRHCWTMTSNNDDDVRNLHEGHDSGQEAEHAAADDDDENFCYEKFRNLTGALAGVALVVLAVTTTFSWIRRRFYTLFWSCHVLAAPLVYIMVILHYEKAILYVAGGVLYYLATSVPVWWEMTNKASLCCNSTSNNINMTVVPIVAVQRIPTGGGSSDGNGGATDTAATATTSCVMSVTIQVDPMALERFRAGQYVRLVAPEISILAHPFTINLCPLSLQHQQQHGPEANTSTTTSTNEDDVANGGGTGHHYYMQIIFRATGHFTKQLAQRLLVMNTNNATLQERPLPVLQLDGFHGPSNRLRTALLEHDVVLIVAGGIGITPYLSLLHQLHQNLVASLLRAKDTHQRRQFRTKRVVFHWMCRDEALIDYIKREYFAPLLDDS
jgi:Ferric reductase like transmembrane component/Ferric reductase NAD binding domain